MNQTFEELYNQINVEIQNQNYEKASEYIPNLFETVADDEQRLYAYLLKINILTALNSVGELVSTYSEFIENFKNSEDEAVKNYILSSFFYKAVTLGKNTQHQEAIKTYDEMIAHFGESTNDIIVEYIAKAMVNKASRYQDLQQFEKAIEVLDEVVAKFETVTNKTLLQVAIALHNKAAILGEMAQEKQMMKICEDIIERFSKYNDEMMQNIVASAQVIKDKEKYNNSF